MSTIDKEFESKIYYFFGIPDSSEVVEWAMKSLVEAKDKTQMLHYLRNAYSVIEKNVGWTFDVSLAAQYEYEMIMAHRRSEPFEEICKYYERLYAFIFGAQEKDFIEIARLRTFIFTYLGDLEEKRPLTSTEKEMLIKMAELSDEMLGHFERRAVNLVAN